MKLTLLLITTLLLISKFNICAAGNTYPVSDCKAHTDNCDNWCEEPERGDLCWNIKVSDSGCFLSKKCYCQCTIKDTLATGSIASAPFEIKAWNGKCLDGQANGDGAVWIYECVGVDQQKWIYYPNNGAVRNLKSNYCLNVNNGRNENGRTVEMWNNNADCVNWETSQWTFRNDGHIKTDIGDRYLDIRGADVWAQIWTWAHVWNQKWTFPAGTYRGKRSGGCEVSKLQQVAVDSSDKLAETAWNLGTTVAGSLPVVGSAVSVVTSLWDPTADDGPSASELVNNVRDEINIVVDELKNCIDYKIENLEAELEQKTGLGLVSQVTTRLEYISGAHGDDQINGIDNLFEDFNGWISSIFKQKNGYLEYENLIPIYESMIPLWSAVSVEVLAIEINENDCNNYKNDLKTIRNRFNTMRSFMVYAISSIISYTIQINSDDAAYNEWKKYEIGVLGKRYLAPIDYYIESLDDISPNLELSCVSNGAFPETDNIITIYKYTRDSGITLSANPASITIQARGYKLSDTEIYKLSDKEIVDTAPVYKKYNIDNDDYWISTDKTVGNSNGYKIVSVLGYCSKSQSNPSIESCDSNIFL